MPEYVEPAIRELRNRDSEGVEDILLGVSGNRDEYVQRLRSLDVGMENLEKVGRSSVRISVPASAVGKICALEGTKSVEVDRADVGTYPPGEKDRETRNSAGVRGRKRTR